jgi:Mn-dependent DtxR family transcriptional regulator
MTPKKRNSATPTPRQRAALVAIRDLQVVTGISPSYDEIAERMAVGKSTVTDLIRGLEFKGYLTRAAAKYRSLRLTLPALEILSQDEAERKQKETA